MENKNLIIVAIVLVILTCIVIGGIILSGAYFYTPKSNNNPIEINSKKCTYEGKIYNEGEGFKASDGCNSCSCTNGRVACTLMACPE
jgi:hypothetical protein